MKLQYLGTAAAEGIPALFCNCEVCKKARLLGGKNIRTRSQSIVDDELLIDFPADTYMHMLGNGLNLSEITACLITHNHSDHLYSADFEMRCNHFSNACNSILKIFGTAQVCDKIKAVLAGKIYENRLEINVIEPFKPFEVLNYKITPLKANHGDEKTGAVIYLIEKDGKAILYAHDTGIFPDETFEYLKNNSVKINFATLDCTEGTKDISYRTHMSFKRNLQVKEQLESIGCADSGTKWSVNHFSHNGENILYDDLVEKVGKYGFEVSYDGKTVEF